MQGERGERGKGGAADWQSQRGGTLDRHNRAGYLVGIRTVLDSRETPHQPVCRATEAHENEQQQQNGEKKGFPPSGMVLVKLVEPWVVQDDPCGVHCVNWEARGIPKSPKATLG